MTCRSYSLVVWASQPDESWHTVSGYPRNASVKPLSQLASLAIRLGNYCQSEVCLKNKVRLQVFPMPVQGIRRNICLQHRKAVQNNKYNLTPSCIDPYQISWPQQQEDEAIKKVCLYD